MRAHSGVGQLLSVCLFFSFFLLDAIAQNEGETRENKRERERKFDDDAYSMASHIYREKKRESSKISRERTHITRFFFLFFYFIVCLSIPLICHLYV